MTTMLPDPTSSERISSRTRLLAALLQNRGRSRSELVSLLGLSRQTVTTLVAEAEQAGLVEQRVRSEEAAGPVMGRPPLRISLASDAAFGVGIEIAHDHVRSAVCNVNGEVLTLHSAPIDIGTHATRIFDLAAELAFSALAESGVPRSKVMGAGAALPAPVDARNGTVHTRDFLPAWRGTHPAAALRERLEMPVRLANDAYAGALGEWLFGAAQAVSGALYVRLSAGIGVGLILGGRPYTGSGGIAGELGHTYVSDQGTICRCGNRGCLETIAGTAAVVARLEQGRKQCVSSAELIGLAHEGHRSARRALTDAGDAVGRVLAGAVNLLNPDRVIVGGDLAAAGAIVTDAIRAGVARGAVAPAAETVEVVTGALGERAEALGAAAIQLERAPAVLAARLEAA
ncbi:ROK family transcriptional regulator [Solirubrobacter taibaiensis]|nr:ROK family transcriptional regulator [Solirubrobacter taibaiensis]